MTKRHEWMTDGIALDASERILAEYEAEGWQVVSLSWDSTAGVFMGVWKRPVTHSESVCDVVIRLRSWIRDYGHEKQPVFIADLKTVLDVISTEE
jgi:hypothetical protein